MTTQPISSNQTEVKESKESSEVAKPDGEIYQPPSMRDTKVTFADKNESDSDAGPSVNQSNKLFKIRESEI